MNKIKKGKKKGLQVTPILAVADVKDKAFWLGFAGRL